MAPLTSSKLRMNQIVCSDNSFDENYAGIFHFRFWIHGKWVEVVVDDRLPVNEYGQLNCLKSRELNEFCSPLLEKAYAKLFGGYEALDGGLPYEAFEDFTGGISEIFDLKKAPKNLYEIMGVACRRGSLLACAVKPDPHIREAVLPNGLVQGHAYSITGVKSIDVKVGNDNYKVDLVRLRNPWGQGEWNGSWSDNSIEWNSVSDEIKKQLEVKIEQDGEFWMSYQDFISLFERMDICNVSPHSLHDDKRINNFWNRELYDGAWIKGKTAGGCRNYIDTYHLNPQYVMTLTNVDETDPQGRCNVLIALMQKNGRSKEKGSHYIGIGFAIHKINENQVSQVPLKNDFFRFDSPVEQSIFTASRGITARYKLPPGHYIVVPTTFYYNQEAEFFLRVCTEKNEAFDEEEFEKYVEKHKNDKRPSKFTPSFKPCKPEDFLPSAYEKDDEEEDSTDKKDESTKKDSAAKKDSATKKDSTGIKDSTPSKPTPKDPSNDKIPAKDQPTVKPTIKEVLETEAIEKLFKDAAGTKREIDWMELKAILDSTIPNESRVKGIYRDYKNDGFSRDICRSIIAMMDTDYSRKLKLDEFKKFYNSYIKWKDAFINSNITKTWKLSPTQFFEALKSLGFNLDASIVNMLIYRYGTPYNTLLFEDFIMCVVKASSMIERFKKKAGDKKESAMFSREDWIVYTLYS